jgi:hypothetical protein
MTPKAQKNLLTAIAHVHLGIETLETRNSDRLDFHDVGVGCLLDALTAAFEAGRLETKQEQERSALASHEAHQEGHEQDQEQER